MIDMINVSLRYDKDSVALTNVNLSIKKGEFAFMVGPSGSGKSSLMKLLLKEREASSGKINVNGFDLTKLRQWKIPKYRRNLGVVFQDFRLIPNMTVYENIAFSMRVTNAKAKYIRERVPYILSIMGLAAKAKKYPHELSGGEQQRVALGRALVNDPPIIIADEPTGNIDPALSYEIVDLLLGINACGTTVLMVTHQQELVRDFGGRVISIEKGTIVSDGYLPPSRLSKDEEDRTISENNTVEPITV